MENGKAKQIIALGGGGFSRPGTDQAFEKYLIAQTGKDNPKVCFLPQASNENREYIVRFYESFCHVGALPSWVSLFDRVKQGWQEHILEQDLIFVGGGNTRSMLALWREWGMDVVLRKAYEKGIVLAGSSAGAICWFQEGVTDSVWPLGVVQGLGILPGSCCPHYDSEKERKPTYLRMTAQDDIKPGIGLEDWAAAHYIDGKLRYCVAKNTKSIYSICSGIEKEFDAQRVLL